MSQAQIDAILALNPDDYESELPLPGGHFVFRSRTGYWLYHDTKEYESRLDLVELLCLINEVVGE